jgi:outer membrane protein
MTFAPLAAERPTPLVRPLLAAVLAVLTAVGPISPAFAQDPQNPAVPAASASAKPSTPTPQAPPIPVTLDVSKHNFQHGPRVFPNLINPYMPVAIEEPILQNSPRIEQLIREGKLELTLQDAVELSLENSVDIAVQRYYPWIADLSILKANSGSPQLYGTPGATFAASTANITPFSTNFPSFDPLVSSSAAFDDRSTPINNPFISGTGAGTSAAAIISHTSQYNTQYSQYFPTGTSVSVTYDNTRSSSSAAANFFNPDVQSSLFIGFSQNLLNGFGAVNRRNILIAKNNRKIADLAFEQQAITTVTNTITAYWELVYARENVKVQEQAVAVSEKLYNDNKKQLEIGTLAPLEVTRAEAQLATDRQSLIAAQTVDLTDQQTLKNAVTRNPLDPRIINIEIVPTDKPTTPEQVEAPTFEEALHEAFAKRPELLEQDYNLKNAAIDIKATRNALLPTATVSAQYGSQGLAGNSILTTSTAAPGAPVVGVNGQPITVLDAGGNPVTIFLPSATTTATGVSHGGFGNANSQIFHNEFPDYNVQMSIIIPIRNRSAQADSQHATLVQRQLQMQQQQLKNAAILDVRNTYIALEQGRASVEAAIKARELQQQTFEAEQKKYQLGASTVYNVILTQRDFVAAQGTELRALANLVEAKANYERAVGRTLEVNRVTVADAASGSINRETLIPGTLNGHVIGTEKIFTSGQK